MLPTLTEILKSYRFNAFIQSWIVMQIQILAGRLHQEAVQAACARALTTIDEAVKLRNTYQLQRHKHLGSDEARQLDLLIDRAVSEAHGLLETKIKGRGPIAAAAARLMEAAFPQGLGAHVQANFQTQATFNKMFVAALRDPVHQQVVDHLHLGEIADQLDELMPQFNVAAGLREPVTGAMVQAAESAGQDALMQLICLLVLTYDQGKPAELALRTQLLRPYMEANEHVHTEYVKRAAKAKEQAAPPKEEEGKDKPCEGGAAEGSGSAAGAGASGADRSADAAGGADAAGVAEPAGGQADATMEVVDPRALPGETDSFEEEAILPPTTSFAEPVGQARTGS